MSEVWRLILSGPVAPADAMALDEALLLAGAHPTLRLYRWNPHAVSLGYFQKFAEFDFNKFTIENVQVVRRLTGGGAIFHGDEVTFSITAPASHALFGGAVLDSYDRVHRVLATAIAACCPPGTTVAARGAFTLRSDIPSSPWCFHESTPFDLAAAKRKLVGSAQRRTGGRVLHHGSIVLNQNRYTPGIASIASLGGDARPPVIESAIEKAFGESLNITFERGEPASAERELAALLAREKYTSDAWTRRR